METAKTKRARRRRDLARKRAEARRIYPHDPKARAAEHLKVCSCWMCGNPRRKGIDRPTTLQEVRAELSEEEFRSALLIRPSPRDGAG